MKFQIPPQTQLERLKLSAMQPSMQRRFGRVAWGSMGGGAFTLAPALPLKTHTAFDARWLTIGFFRVIEGSWIVRSAAADQRVLRVESFALMVLGLLNTVGLCFEIKRGLRPVGSLQLTFAGIVQIVSAYGIFRSRPAYKAVYEHLDRAWMHELETKIDDMWKRKSGTDRERAGFRYEDKKCKAKFLSGLAILLLQDARQVLSAENFEIKIESARNMMMSKKFRVEPSIEQEKFETDTKKENLEKWQAWLRLNRNPYEVNV